MKKGALETPPVQSLDRGLMILEAVAKSSDPVPLGQLRELLGINRSSVFRLANTLRRRGFLANPNGRHEYVIGPSICVLFRNYDWSMLVSFCRPHLKQLANQTGETAHLAIREGRKARFIDHQTPPSQVIAVTGRTGEFMPLYCTAHGKALLADCNSAELTAIFGAEKFEKHTKQTIRTIAKLAEACAKIKVQGFSLDEAEFVEEVRCVASPVRGKDGSILAAIGISAPVARLSGERLTSTARRVASAAKLIGEGIRTQL